MKVQVFYPNKDGKIEFTKKELEKLLQEVYDDGHADGYTQGKNERYTWYPSITTPYYSTTVSSNKTVDTTPELTWSTTANNSGDVAYDIHLTTARSTEDTVCVNSSNKDYGYNPYQE